PQRRRGGCVCRRKRPMIASCVEHCVGRAAQASLGARPLGKERPMLEEATEREPPRVAAAYLALLAERGGEVLFGNAGTDFAPLVEAYALCAQGSAASPRPIIATHENLAVAMAHGYGMVSRKIPAVMVHVSVGTANMVCATMNAARENVAMLLT